VLFVGNSLTYENDLPRVVAWISRRGSSSPSLVTETIAFPGAALEDHWRRGEALARIDAGGWDVVVLQQGPSSLPESRSHLVAWTRRFAERIGKAGATPALYMVWPARDRAGDRPRVAASYRAAARAVDAPLLPAGEAWVAAWRSDPTLPLYGGDGFHPSPLGTYAAALVVEAVLTGRPPYDGAADLEAAGATLEVDAELGRRLARAASVGIAAEASR
jgi:hypothetical protein